MNFNIAGGIRDLTKKASEVIKKGTSGEYIEEMTQGETGSGALKGAYAGVTASQGAPKLPPMIQEKIEEIKSKYTPKDISFLKALKDKGISEQEALKRLESVKQRKGIITQPITQQPIQPQPTGEQGQGVNLEQFGIPSKPTGILPVDAQKVGKDVESKGIIGTLKDYGTGAMATLANAAYQVPESIGTAIRGIGEAQANYASPQALYELITGETPESLKQARELVKEPQKIGTQLTESAVQKGKEFYGDRPLAETVGRGATKLAFQAAPYVATGAGALPTLGASLASTTLTGAEGEEGLTTGKYITNAVVDQLFNKILPVDKKQIPIEQQNKIRSALTGASQDTFAFIKAEPKLVEQQLKNPQRWSNFVDETKKIINEFKVGIGTNYAQESEKALAQSKDFVTKGDTIKFMKENILDTIKKVDASNVSKIDFSKSVLAGNTTAQKEIQGIFDRLIQSSDTLTAEDINILKQQIEFLEKGNLPSAIKNKIRGAYRMIEDKLAPELIPVKEMYKAGKEGLEEIGRLGKNATNDQIVSNLKNLFNPSNEGKLSALEQMLQKEGKLDFLKKLRAVKAAEEISPVFTHAGASGYKRMMSNLLTTGGGILGGAVGGIIPGAVAAGTMAAASSPKLWGIGTLKRAQLDNYLKGTIAEPIMKGLGQLKGATREEARKTIKDLLNSIINSI